MVSVAFYIKGEPVIHRRIPPDELQRRCALGINGLCKINEQLATPDL